MKLTALFVARNGREFMSHLSTKEARNYQFDFLRPTHSLFSTFTKLVEHYTKILLCKSLPPFNRLQIIRVSKQRAEWDSVMHERKKKRQLEDEAERGSNFVLILLTFNMIAANFMSIDWNDFVIVQTVEFSSLDDKIDLPPPLSVAQLESMSLAQRKALMKTVAAPPPKQDADMDVLDV